MLPTLFIQPAAGGIISSALIGIVSGSELVLDAERSEREPAVGEDAERGARVVRSSGCCPSTTTLRCVFISMCVWLFFCEFFRNRQEKMNFCVSC